MRTAMLLLFSLGIVFWISLIKEASAKQYYYIKVSKSWINSSTYCSDRLNGSLVKNQTTIKMLMSSYQEDHDLVIWAGDLEVLSKWIANIGCYQHEPSVTSNSRVRTYSCESVFECQLICSKNKFNVFSMKNTTCVCMNSIPSPASRSAQDEDCNIDCHINTLGEKCGGRDVSSVYKVFQISNTHNTSWNCMTTICSNTTNLQIQADDCDRKLEYFCTSGQLENGKVHPVYLKQAWASALKWCRMYNNTVLAVNTSSKLCSSSIFQSSRFWRGEFRGIFIPRHIWYDVLADYTKICQCITYSQNAFKTIKSCDCEEKHFFLCQTDDMINTTEEVVNLLQISHKNYSFIEVNSKASVHRSTTLPSSHLPHSTNTYSIINVPESDIHGLTKFSQLYPSSSQYDQYNYLNVDDSSQPISSTLIMYRTAYINSSVIKDEEWTTASSNKSLIYFTDVKKSTTDNFIVEDIMTTPIEPSLTYADSVILSHHFQSSLSCTNSFVDGDRTWTSHVNKSVEESSTFITMTNVKGHAINKMSDTATHVRTMPSELASSIYKSLSDSSKSEESLDVSHYYSINIGNITNILTASITTIYPSITVYNAGTVDVSKDVTTEAMKLLVKDDMSQITLVPSVYKYSSLVVGVGISDVMLSAASSPSQNVHNNVMQASHTREDKPYTEHMALSDTFIEPTVTHTIQDMDHVRSQMDHRFNSHNLVLFTDYHYSGHKASFENFSAFDLKPSSVFEETVASTPKLNLTVTESNIFHSSDDIEYSQSNIKQGRLANEKQINTSEMPSEMSLYISFNNSHQSDSQGPVKSISLSRTNDIYVTTFDNIRSTESDAAIVIHPSATEGLISMSFYQSENINLIEMSQDNEISVQASVLVHSTLSSQRPLHPNTQKHLNKEIGRRKAQIVIISIVGAALAVLSAVFLVLKILILRSKIKMRRTKREVNVNQKRKTTENIYEECVEGVLKL